MEPPPDARVNAIARLGVLERSGDPTLTALTRIASYITGARGAAVHVLDDQAQHRVAGTGVPLGEHGREDSMCRLVVDSDERIVCADASVDPRFGYSSFVRGDAPVRFYASLPLRTSERLVIGTLCAFDTVEVELSEEQEARLEDLAEQVVAQLELMRIAVELGHVASHDPLTGAVNRLVLGDRLAQAFARRRRRGGETFVALLDVDEFKSINDHRGHDAGDQVLVELVTRLHRATRETDTVARVGGDEFVVLSELEPATVDGESLAERIADALAPPMPIDGEPLDIAVSLGWVYATPGEAPRALLARADAAMYRVKSRPRREV